MEDELSKGFSLEDLFKHPEMMQSDLLLGLCLVMSVFLAVSFVSAENASMSDIFTGGSAITPPALEGMWPGNATDAIAPPAGGSARNPILMLGIVDIGTGQKVSNAHIRMTLDNGKERIDTLRFIGADGVLKLQLQPGVWSIILRLDLTSTEGQDYYSSTYADLITDRNDTAFMQPVGSLRGEVYDSGNSLLPAATVKFDCGQGYGDTSPLITDDFGSFKADFLPTGSCKVSALLAGKAGSQTLQITQGQITEVKIVLEQSVALGGLDYIWYLLLAVVAIAAVAHFVLMPRRHSIPLLPKPHEGAPPITPDSHMIDILSALDANERKIVELVMASGGKSEQNKLGRELGLPKSSLSRAVSGLEARSILKTEKLGRTRRVELSERFLGRKVS